MKLKQSLNRPSTKRVLVFALVTLTTLVGYRSLKHHLNTKHEHSHRGPIALHLEGHNDRDADDVRVHIEVRKKEMQRMHEEIARAMEDVHEELSEIEHEDLARIKEDVMRSIEGIEVDLRNGGEEVKLQELVKRSLEAAQRGLEEASRAGIAIRIDGNRGELIVDETFDVREGQDLVVNVPGADVSVSTGSSNQAEIQIYLDARDMERARAYVESLNLEVFQSGDRVVVETERSRNRNWNWRKRGGAELAVDISVPRRFNVDVKTSGGDVDLEELAGEVSLMTSGGDIEIENVSGPMARIKTSGGDIDVESVECEDIELSTSGGDISGNGLAGEDITIRTSGGDIEFTSLVGDANVSTSGGDITMSESRGHLKAGTSGGRIEVGLTGSDGAELRTSGGNIVIKAPGSLAARLELKGGSVKLDDVFSFDGTRKNNRASGTVNGGGPTISASTSGGTVSVTSIGG